STCGLSSACHRGGLSAGSSAVREGGTDVATGRKARFGFIGAAWWATANHIPVLRQRDDVELVGVCRPGAAQLRQVQDALGFPFATESGAPPWDPRIVTTSWNEYPAPRGQEATDKT